MDIVAEDIKVSVSKVVVEEPEGGSRSTESSNLVPAAAALIQAPFLPSLESCVNLSRSPSQFEPHSLTASASVPSPAATPTLVHPRAAEMSLASVEPLTASLAFLPSSSAVRSSAPSSLPNDTSGLVLPPSLSSRDLSVAPRSAFVAYSISSSYEGSPAVSHSFTTVSPPSSTPFSSTDMIQALSGAQFSDSGSESRSCTERLDTPQPGVPSVAAEVKSSAVLLTPPASVSPGEVPLPPSLEMSSAEEPATATDTSSFSTIDVSEQHLLSGPPSTSASTGTPSTLLSSTSSRTEFLPHDPSYSREILSTLPSQSGSNLEMITSSESLPLPDVPPSDPATPSELPVEASTGLLTEHERSSLETTTSVPSGTSTIATTSPSLMFPTAFPQFSECKIPNLSSVSSSNQSSVGPNLKPSLLTDHDLALSTSCVELLSSVKAASSSSPLAAIQIAPNPAAIVNFHSSSTSGGLSPSSGITESRVSSLPWTAPCSDFISSGNPVAPIISTPLTVPQSLVSHLPTSLQSSTAIDSAGRGLLAGSGAAMDSTPSLSSVLLNRTGTSSSSGNDVSPFLHEFRSINKEMASNSGPPVAPTSESCPRKRAIGGQKGKGWPYAPQGWPDRDDQWFWRVGKRVHINGYFKDRFLGLPKGLCKGRKITEFASKRSIVEYLKENFPDLSVENFFKSFQWRVPCVNYRNSYSTAALKANALKRQRPAEEDVDAPNTVKRPKKECRAGNLNCGLETGKSVLLGNSDCSACDICCTEPGFCRECKCILCCKIIVPETGESNFVRCLQNPSGSGLCGHAAHLECALHSKMAGVVKKRGLDMEYLCRRCDSKSDLRELVTLLLEALATTEMRTQAEKSLELALEVMKGTERGGSGARVLESLVQTALRKVRSGVDIRETFRELRDQGAAAEAARQQNLVRSSSLVEDVSQQPEASLDQWLPSSGSPSSHPSPGTPSSFTSPRIRSNPSVTSGQLNGNQSVDGLHGKHMVVEGHTYHHGEPQISHEGFTNSHSKYKNSHLGNKSLMRNAGQARGSHRMRAVSSNVNNNGLEAISDSYTTRATEYRMAEPSSRDGNSSQWVNHNSESGTKVLKDQKTPASGGAGEEIMFTEICRSCGTMRQHKSNALEVTSSRRFPKIEDGGKKGLHSPLKLTEDEPGDSDNHKQVAESDTGVDWSGPQSSTLYANAAAHKAIVASLGLLLSQCERDVNATLQKLRQSQEAEFERAKSCLSARKESIMRKYELMGAAWSDFSEQPVLQSLEAFDELLLKTANQFGKAIEERENFKTMLKVGEGFGRVSKDDLSKFYGWSIEK